MVPVLGGRRAASGQQVFPELALSQGAVSHLESILSSQVRGSPGKVPPASNLPLVLVPVAHTPSVTLGPGSFPGGSFIETKAPWDQPLPAAWYWDPRTVCSVFGSPGKVKGEPPFEGLGVCCWLQLPRGSRAWVCRGGQS